jgi:hypothetical protein
VRIQVLPQGVQFRRACAFGQLRVQRIGLRGIADGGLGHVLEVIAPSELLALPSQLLNPHLGDVDPSIVREGLAAVNVES